VAHIKIDTTELGAPYLDSEMWAFARKREPYTLKSSNAARAQAISTRGRRPLHYLQLLQPQSLPQHPSLQRYLSRTCPRSLQVELLGYVVMRDHVHLLMSEPPGVPLSKALQALKISVSRRLVQRPFWQPRYYDFNVFTHNKRVEKLKYMHRNPVTRGLVTRPEVAEIDLSSNGAARQPRYHGRQVSIHRQTNENRKFEPKCPPGNWARLRR
jgi:REP element-mobilizing transposase RayT